jgi:hypothetical protein
VSHLPRATARAIDRFARGAHAFHRFAHHPLCGEYAGEVVRVGRRVRVCRGCSLAALGFLTGALVTVPLPVSVLLLAGAWTLTALPRGRSKLASRFLPAALAAASIASGLRAANVGGAAIALAGLGFIALVIVRYRRRGPSRGPCASCPERALPVPCRGHAAIVRRERAFRRAAANRFRLGELGP